MSWTTTCDMSHKVKGGGGHATGFFKHLARDVDAAEGFHFNHSNDGLDPARLGLNRTVVNDGAGGYRRPTSVDGRPPSAEAGDYLEQRLATVARKPRKDAVLMRPIVFKADPEWYDEISPGWRVTGLNEEALRLHEEATRWVEGYFGQQNVVMWSDHLDEAGHPERQLAVAMVTEDGRLSQKDFFPGPTAMKKMHQDLRKHLKDTCGYEAEMDVSPRSREHLSSADYQRKTEDAKRKLAKAEKELAGVIERDKTARREVMERARTLDEREGQLNDRENRLNEREGELGEWAKEVGDREKAVKTTEIGQRNADRALAERSTLASGRMQAAIAKEAQVNRVKEALREIVNELPETTKAKLNRVLRGVPEVTLGEGNQPKQQPGDPQYT